MIDSPCKNCDDRSFSCWGKCQRYLAFQKEKDAMKKRIAAARKEMDDLIQTRTRSKKRRWKKEWKHD